MPLEITISQDAQSFSTRLGLEPQSMIRDILAFVPRSDLVGLAAIVVEHQPHKRRVRNATALAAYHRAFDGKPARIEVYVQNLLGYLGGPESLALVLPIVQVGLAETLFHEVGHHVQHTRTHGIHKGRAEPFARGYAKRVLSRFVLSRADSVEGCFARLYELAEEKSLDTVKIEAMRRWWATECAEAIASAASPNEERAM